MSGAEEAGEVPPEGHVAVLGMGAAGDFGQGAGVIGLYSSPAVEGGDPVAAADRLWALGDYPRALGLLRSAVGALDDGGGVAAAGERARLENNLGCLYAALLRPKEAIAVLEACRDRLGGQGGGGVPEVLDVNLGLCYLQLADLTARRVEYFLEDGGAFKARLAGVDVRSENATAIFAEVRSAEDNARKARLARVDRLRGKAVEVFEALLRRNAQDPESLDACFLRDCLVFSLLAGHDDYSLWPAPAAVRARRLFRENRTWHAAMSGESAAATLRSRARGPLSPGCPPIAPGRGVRRWRSCGRY